MKKTVLISILLPMLLALSMTLGCIEGPAAVVPDTDAAPVSTPTEVHTFTLAIDRADAEWSAFVLGGDSVVLHEATDGRLIRPGEETTLTDLKVFVLDAVKPGSSIIRIAKTGDTSEEILLHVAVNDALMPDTTDVTESGVIEGVVTGTSEAERTVTLDTADRGEVIATIPDDSAMPVPNETVRLYTDGVMTLSLPPIVNAIAWSAVPSAEQRNGK